MVPLKEESVRTLFCEAARGINGLLETNMTAADHFPLSHCLSTLKEFDRQGVRVRTLRKKMLLHLKIKISIKNVIYGGVIPLV